MNAGFSLGTDLNRAIKASAGSGKTFQLAMRFIAILFLDPQLDPAQIVAITFTRKAAAEILNKIIDQLLDMERNPNLLAERIRQGLLPPELTADAIPELLGRILSSRELQVSTIDSFFVKIIQAFAPEFGLSGTVEMIDASRDAGEKDTISGLIRSQKEALFPLLRDYAQGSDARNFTDTLKKFLENNYRIYLLYPQEKLWGNLPEAQDSLTGAEREKIFVTLTVGMEHYNYHNGIKACIRAIMEAAKTGNCGELKAFFSISGPEDDLSFTYYKKAYSISKEMMKGIEALSHYIAVTDLRKKIAKSRAAYQLLKLYDTLYAANIRSAGRLMFRDLPKLLGEIGEEDKLDLEYRMDSRNRHYMLDEFQDTSTPQWNFMNNLMAEAIQGTEQSFFMVGDVKQSLYQWRFGNPKLFDDICDAYCIETRHSDRSFRSAPAVIEAVNQVFATPKNRLDRDAEAMKRMGFQAHETAKTEQSGYAALLQVSPKCEIEDRAQEVYNLLTTIEPLKRGLSAAILLRTNKEVETYKQCLRAIDSTLPITTEGVTTTDESMACTFLILLLRLAEHPADVLANKVLPCFAWDDAAPFTATQISEALNLPESASLEALSAHLRRLLAEQGIAGVVRRFQEAYADSLSCFDRERLAIMAHQAEDFTGSVDDYLSSLSQAQGSGTSAERTIQIMTIHKSKGLEFDVVILPELNAPKNGGGAKLVIAPEDDRNHGLPTFISYMPVAFAEQFLPEITKINTALYVDTIYEKCCGLYVAMTRAKRGLYMFVANNVGKPGKSFRADQVLVNALCGKKQDAEALTAWHCGDAKWFLPLNTPSEAAPATAAPALSAIPVRRTAAPAWHSPSRPSEDTPETSAILPEYRFENSTAAGLGSRIHAMLEAVEYLDNVDMAKIRAIAGNDDIAPQALELWETIVSGGEIASALRRPAIPAELWRERDFLMQNAAGELVSGCFDRVEIVRDAAGKAQSATIWDYKSDCLTDPADFLVRHQAQLNAYRQALARMLELPEAQIECIILALRPGLRIRVEVTR